MFPAMTHRLSTRPPLPLLAALAVPALALSACSTTTSPEEAGGAVVVDEHEDEHEDEHDDGDHGEEAAERTPRLAAAYDGGLLVLDGLTLELVADLELPGFNRLNPAGDGRHVLVSTTAGDEPGFQVLDLGTWAEAHGDHAHYFTAEPELTDVVLPATTRATRSRTAA